jgi:hypothetical protein
MATKIPAPTGAGTDEPAIDPGTLALMNSPSPSSTATTAQSASIKWRPLTPGEISMAALLFKNSIDYSRVKVHNEGYFPFGLQSDDTAVTPNGEIYFKPKNFKHDFSAAPTADKLWFIHEMAHVWQYQLGYGVKMAGLRTDYRGGKAYEYEDELAAATSLNEFNFEQQGDIFKDYYADEFLGMILPPQKKELLKKILREFLENPKNEKLLPNVIFGRKPEPLDRH